MSLIRRIYVDMDDTLNSFTMFAMGQLGLDVGPFDYHKFPTKVGYDIEAAYAWYTAIEQDSAGFWNSLDSLRISLRAPVLDYAHTLIQDCIDKVGRRNVWICTKPFSPQSAADKMLWIERHFPNMKHQFLLTTDKSQLAKDALLIDDCDEHCTAFSNAGGQSLLVPRPWNYTQCKSGFVYDHIKDHLNFLRQSDAFVCT